MLNTYSGTDMHAPAGIVYYRLQSVENSGASFYSNIISFNNINAQSFNVYPSLVRVIHRFRLPAQLTVVLPLYGWLV